MSSTEIGRYRSITSKLVSGLAVLAEQMEDLLQGPAGEGEPEQETAGNHGWADGLGLGIALLLRRTRYHAVAVVRANEACNAHSLGVQMRPALECAGQTALIMRNLMLDPERGPAKFSAYLDADYYGTTIRATKGEIGHDHLLEQLTSIKKRAKEDAERVLGGDLPSYENAGGRHGGSRKLRHIDKVAELNGGKNWYRYLSEHFCHGDPAGERETWRGGVVSANTPRDEFACAGMMDYLANQMAVMIAYAAMCPTDGRVDEARVNNALAQFEKIRAKTKKHRNLAVSERDSGSMHGLAG